MINKRINIGFLALIYFQIKLLGAQQVPNTSSNQGNSVSSLQPRFSDLGAMGLPNLGSGRFGNPTSNYPVNSFSPFGNQNDNMQHPQQGSGMGDQNQNPNQGNYQNRPILGDYPDQRGYPYQGDVINPSPTYQQPQYPNNPNDRLMYPDQIPNQGGLQNRPVQGGYHNEERYPYQGDNMNQYPNYQRPSYPNDRRPNDGQMNPGNINRPYGNQDGNYNQPMNGQGRPGQFQYPSQGGQYPSQDNFQGNGSPNFRPGQNNNFRPYELNNLPNTNIQFPDRPYHNQPNQYYPQNGFPYQNNQNFRPGQPHNFRPYTSNNNPNSNIQFPTNPSMAVNGDPSATQFPNPGISNPGRPVNQGLVLNPGNVNSTPQNQPQLPNNQGMDSINSPNYNNTVAILGKPVIVPATSPGQIVFDNSTENPTQKKCVQDCPTTSEYNPVCGSNNVTYFNPEKFACARNCGEVVYLHQNGRCDDDVANSFVKP